MDDQTRLVAVCGLPGAGKTTVAEAVADRLDAELVRTDVVRKELFDAPEYTAAESDRTYEAVFERAAAALAADTSAVLDGTFRTESRRADARAVAARRGVPFDLLRVTCAESVAKARIREREGDESDADVAVYDLLAGEFEPVERGHRVDNSGALAETLERVEAVLAESAREPAVDHGSPR